MNLLAFNSLSEIYWNILNYNVLWFYIILKKNYSPKKEYKNNIRTLYFYITDNFTAEL